MVEFVSRANTQLNYLLLFFGALKQLSAYKVITQLSYKVLSFHSSPTQKTKIILFCSENLGLFIQILEQQFFEQKFNEAVLCYDFLAGIQNWTKIVSTGVYRKRSRVKNTLVVLQICFSTVACMPKKILSINFKVIVFCYINLSNLL